MRKCPFCYKELSFGEIKGHHIYKCESRGDLGKNDIKASFLAYNFPLIATKEKLEEEYVVKQKSLPDIKNEFGLWFKETIFLLKYYGFETRSIKVSSSLPQRKKKFETTCLKKYGKINVLSRGTDAYDKRNKTVQERYGVNNVFQIEVIKEKITSTIMGRYGVKRVCNPEKISEARLKFNDEKWGDIEKKRVATSRKNYGTDWPCQTKKKRKEKSEVVKKYWKELPEEKK